MEQRAADLLLVVAGLVGVLTVSVGIACGWGGGDRGRTGA